MKRHYYIFQLFLICLLSCNINKDKAKNVLQNVTPFKKQIAFSTIHILPLGKVSYQVLNDVQSGLKQFYKKEVIVDKEVPLDKSLLAKSGLRYSADSILKKFANNNVTLIITEKDIISKKDKIEEYGIFGLGYQPGKTCVISPFRPRWHSTPAILRDRLQKISIHEVGHNLGLPHCTNNKECLMNAANGTIKQVDQEKMFFCEACKKKIK
jgi:archaemetzincin